MSLWDRLSKPLFVAVAWCAFIAPNITDWITASDFVRYGGEAEAFIAAILQSILWGWPLVWVAVAWVTFKTREKPKKYDREYDREWNVFKRKVAPDAFIGADGFVIKGFAGAMLLLFIFEKKDLLLFLPDNRYFAIPILFLLGLILMYFLWVIYFFSVYIFKK